MSKIIEKNREYAEKFIQKIEYQKVPKHLCSLIKDKNFSSLLDLGCGEGILINSIKREFPKIKITGIDISPRRIGNLKKKFPKEKFYCRDVCDTRLKNKFDLINCSQVIEHVENDEKLVREMEKLIKKSGYLVVDSIIKKSFAIYKYRNNRKFVLDPTHEREYKNQREFLDLFKQSFSLIQTWVSPVKRRFLFFQIKIPGYYLVYGIWKKRK